MEITYAIPVPVHQEADFILKLPVVVILCLHGTVTRFCTGIRLLLWYSNWGELAPVWLGPVWHFLVVSCKWIQSHERKPGWTCTGMIVTPVSCEHPLRVGGWLGRSCTKKGIPWFSQLMSHYVMMFLVGHYHDRVQHPRQLFTGLGLIRSVGFWIVTGKRVVNTTIQSNKLRGQQ